jgi:hypothetical protein
MTQMKLFNVPLVVSLVTVQTARMDAVEIHYLHPRLSMVLDVTASRGLVKVIQPVVVVYHET